VALLSEPEWTIANLASVKYTGWYQSWLPVIITTYIMTLIHLQTE